MRLQNAFIRVQVPFRPPMRLARKYCVTGGAGFIGSNFLHSMMKKYPTDQFVCLDAFTYAGRTSNLSPVINNPNFSLHAVDISNKAEIDEIFFRERFDYVINFAAESHVDASIMNPDIFVKSNIVGTHVLLEASRKNNIKRYHQISTDEVYGDLPIDKPKLLFTEQSLIKPSSPYSASKASADMLVMAYQRTFDLPATISRCSNNYGPYQHEEKLIPKVIKKVMNNEPMTIYGSGIQIRDWIHVSDHNNAIDLILEKGIPGEVYNIGGNTELTNLQVVKTILQLLGKPEDFLTHVSERAGHDQRYAIDNSKVRRVLGWYPLYSFEQGIVDTVKWYTK